MLINSITVYKWNNTDSFTLPHVVPITVLTVFNVTFFYTLIKVSGRQNTFFKIFGIVENENKSHTGLVRNFDRI